MDASTEGPPAVFPLNRNTAMMAASTTIATTPTRRLRVFRGRCRKVPTRSSSRAAVFSSVTGLVSGAGPRLDTTLGTGSSAGAGSTSEVMMGTWSSQWGLIGSLGFEAPVRCRSSTIMPSGFSTMNGMADGAMNSRRSAPSFANPLARRSHRACDQTASGWCVGVPTPM